MVIVSDLAERDHPYFCFVCIFLKEFADISSNIICLPSYWNDCIDKHLAFTDCDLCPIHDKHNSFHQLLWIKLLETVLFVTRV